MPERGGDHINEYRQTLMRRSGSLVIHGSTDYTITFDCGVELVTWMAVVFTMLGDRGINRRCAKYVNDAAYGDIFSFTNKAVRQSKKAQKDAIAAAKPTREEDGACDLITSVNSFEHYSVPASLLFGRLRFHTPSSLVSRKMQVLIKSQPFLHCSPLSPYR